MYKNGTLDYKDVMNLISNLAGSQGFYGRLREQILSLDREELKKFKHWIRVRQFKNVVDFIMSIEN